LLLRAFHVHLVLATAAIRVVFHTRLEAAAAAEWGTVAWLMRCYPGDLAGPMAGHTDGLDVLPVFRLIPEVVVVLMPRSSPDVVAVGAALRVGIGQLAAKYQPADPIPRL
jgi:hypothetical protein